MTRVFLIAIEPPSSMLRHGSPCVTTYQDRLLLVFGVVIGVFYVVTRKRVMQQGLAMGEGLVLRHDFSYHNRDWLRKDIRCCDGTFIVTIERSAI